MSRNPTNPARTNAWLLIVDDNEDNRYFLKQRLQHEGYRNILEAMDGVAALELLATREVDLVLLDVLMPEMDGHQLLTDKHRVESMGMVAIRGKSAAVEIFKLASTA